MSVPNPDHKLLELFLINKNINYEKSIICIDGNNDYCFM